MDEIYEEIVFEKTCRTCLEQDMNQEFLPLFNGSQACKLTRPEVLEEVLFFNLGLWENDGLPQQMCLNCVDIFASCSEFRKQCNETQDKLATYHALGRVNVEKIEVQIEKIEFIDVVDHDEKTIEDNEDILNFPTHDSKDSDSQDEYLIETLNNDENEEKGEENIDEAELCDNNSNNKIEKYTYSVKYCRFCKGKFPRNVSRTNHFKACPDRNVELCEYCTGEFKTTAMLEEHLEEIHKDNKDPMCPVCYRTFANDSSRNAHVLNYHSGKPEKYECNTCQGLFKTRTSLRNHILCYHKPTKYQCTICQMHLRNIFRYRYHMKMHNTKKKYQCQYCDKTFIQIGPKRNHELLHTGERPHLCNFCGQGFKHIRYLRHHIERRHDDTNKTDNSTVNSALDNKENEAKDGNINGHANAVVGRKYYVCKYCKKRFFRTKIASHTQICTKRNSLICELCTDEFESAEKLEAHTKEIHKDDKRPSCNICYHKFSTDAYRKVHVRAYHSNGERQWTCNICSRACRTRSGLWNHMRRIHSEKKFQCSLCPKQLNNVFQYRYHMKAHNPKRKFQCQYCDKSFMQLHHKENHENVHTGERPHLCNVCGKGYRTDQQLVFHIARFHSDEKIKTGSRKHKSAGSRYPFNCTLCSKGFLVGNALARHLKTHTDKERKHVCEHCGQAFTRIIYLNGHVKRVHLKLKTIPCDFCDKLFLTKGEMTAHMVTHRDEKPYKCSYCANTYKWKKNLICHERSHTGEKPYQCEICYKQFAWHKTLSVHTMTDHSDDQKKSLEENILQGLINIQDNVEIDVES